MNSPSRVCMSHRFWLTPNADSTISAFYAASGNGLDIAVISRSISVNVPVPADGPRVKIWRILIYGLPLLCLLSSKSSSSPPQRLWLSNSQSMDLLLPLQFCKLRVWAPTQQLTLRRLRLFVPPLTLLHANSRFKFGCQRSPRNMWPHVCLALSSIFDWRHFFDSQRAVSWST